jgi:hypothetical protein
MGALMIRCRETGQDLYTGIDMDERTYAHVPNVSMQTACPYCGATHVWWTREAHMANELPMMWPKLSPKTANQLAIPLDGR